jgi:hypothetical protein
MKAPRGLAGKLSMYWGLHRRAGLLGVVGVDRSTSAKLAIGLSSACGGPHAALSVSC